VDDRACQIIRQMVDRPFTQPAMSAGELMETWYISKCTCVEHSNNVNNPLVIGRREFSKSKMSDDQSTNEWLDLQLGSPPIVSNPAPALLDFSFNGNEFYVHKILNSIHTFFF